LVSPWTPPFAELSLAVGHYRIILVRLDLATAVHWLIADPATGRTAAGAQVKTLENHVFAAMVTVCRQAPVKLLS
jgi:hypothetical protein